MAEPDIGLAHFTLRLMARLQAMGTVPAIDIDLYTAGLASGASQGLGTSSGSRRCWVLHDVVTGEVTTEIEALDHGAATHIHPRGC